MWALLFISACVSPLTAAVQSQLAGPLGAFIIHGFASAKECNELRELAEPRLEPSQVSRKAQTSYQVAPCADRYEYEHGYEDEYEGLRASCPSRKDDYLVA